MTIFEAISLAIAVLGPVAGFALSDQRARGRSDGVAERVAKLEGLAERVTRLEGRMEESTRRHDELREVLKEMRAEIMAALRELDARGAR